MAEATKPKDITLQRISPKNKNRVTKYGKIVYGESFNDALERVLDEYEKMKKSKNE